MASWFGRCTPDRESCSGVTPGRGHCDVFLDKIYTALAVPFSTPLCEWIPANLAFHVRGEVESLFDTKSRGNVTGNTGYFGPICRLTFWRGQFPLTCTSVEEVIIYIRTKGNI